MSIPYCLSWFVSRLALPIASIYPVPTSLTNSSNVSPSTNRPKKTPSSLSDVFTDEDVPKDGWDNEIQLVTPGPGRMKFDLVSYGADGSSGGTGADEDLKWSELKN